MCSDHEDRDRRGARAVSQTVRAGSLSEDREAEHVSTVVSSYFDIRVHLPATLYSYSFQFVHLRATPTYSLCELPKKNDAVALREPASLPLCSMHAHPSTRTHATSNSPRV